MLKRALIIAVVVGIGAAVAFKVAGLQIELDGSGIWPRFVSTVPDYEALEADRARERERSSGARAESAAMAQPEQPRAAVAPPAPGDVTPASAEGPVANGTASPRGHWPDFRGPNRDGRYDETTIRTVWPAGGLPQLWKRPVGAGYASFVAADGRAYTIEQRRQQEVVAAYDVETGRELWTHGWDGAFVESMGGDGPRATPTYHDGRVYALGALGELRCLDARTGALLWRHDILAENRAPNLTWGMSAAPLVVDDKVIVLPGGPQKSVVAYHRMTGAPVWSTLDDPQAYTSPMLVTIGGVRQILVVTARRAVGLTVDEGRVLWEYPWVTYMAISVSQPLLLGGDRIFLSAGYDHGAAVFEVTRAGQGFTTRTVWSNNRMKNKFTSSVLRNGYIYGLDEAILACLDAATGELKWKGGRYGYGQVMLAGEHLIMLAESGEVALVRATPDRYIEVSTFQAISGKTWNHPIIVDGRLLVRNEREMAAFDLRAR